MGRAKVSREGVEEACAGVVRMWGSGGEVWGEWEMCTKGAGNEGGRVER